MANRLSTEKLHSFFLKDLGDSFILLSDLGRKPLLFAPKNNPTLLYKAYVFNCTNPPGGRQLDEYKIQLKLPGQKESERGFLDESDGSIILIVGFAQYTDDEEGAWIIWETSRHKSFAFNANLQVKLGMILDVITKQFYHVKKRGNGETIVLSDRFHLREAIYLRNQIDIGMF